MTTVRIVEGDLLEQPAEVIVNAWNRNVIPWWLLAMTGVSRAIKRRAGVAPFRELARHGPMPLGTAVLTGAGELPFRAIIHVAGIDLLWRASERSVRDSVRHAVDLAVAGGLRSLALPLIGAQSGKMGEARSEVIILDELARRDVPLEVLVVRYRP
jgi:O-acetyl-ADP-ribose deacetylase (regulator of RNase III)